jgi:hypothetical protein
MSLDHWPGHLALTKPLYIILAFILEICLLQRFREILRRYIDRQLNFVYASAFYLRQ